MRRGVTPSSLHAQARRRYRRRAAAVLFALGLATLTVLGYTSGGAGNSSDYSTALVRIHFEFKADEFATHYTVQNTGNPNGSLDLFRATYLWKLTPPENDKTCDNHGVLDGTGREFVWKHGNVGQEGHDDGCNHNIGLPGSGHQGKVAVTVEDATWLCTASYVGTQAADGKAIGNGPEGSCTRRPRDCDKQKAALAAAEGKVAALKETLKLLQNAIADTLAKQDAAAAELKKAQSAGKEGGEAAADALTLAEQDELDSKLVTDLERTFDLEPHLRRAEKDLVEAREALAACQRGGSGSRSTAARPSATSKPLVCGAQKIALAKAQARLSVYKSVSRSLRRIGLRKAQAKLLAAQRLLVNAKAKVPATPKGHKAAKALDAAAVAAGRAAAAVGRLIAAAGRVQAKVKPTQQQVARAKRALAKCSAQPSPPAVSISGDDTWAWNTAIGKGNICINVRTTPVQASVTASLSGPNGYSGQAPKSPLHADGTAQIRGPITQAGSYTKTLVVYDASGKQTATATKTFTVAASPQNGPAATPTCPKPTQ